jgi:hypothetical protein
MTQCLLPLMKCVNLEDFHGSLVDAIFAYLSKDFLFGAQNLVVAFVKYWPHKSAKRQIAFLSQVGDFLAYYEQFKSKYYSSLIAIKRGLEIDTESEIKINWIPLIIKVIGSIVSLHYQVSENAILLLNNQKFIEIISEHPMLI